MATLTVQQRNALTGYLRGWQITAGPDVEVPHDATDRFCELILRDQPWSEMWSGNDLKNLIQDALEEVLRTAGGPVLAAPSLMREKIASHLQKKLESYPRDYFVYVELPGLNPSRLDEELLVLSGQISLLRTSPPFEQIGKIVRPKVPKGGGNLLSNVESIAEAREALRPISAFLLERDSVYLQIAESGALPDRLLGENEPALLIHALASVKIIVFFGLEVGLFERREIFRSRHRDAGPRTITHVAIHEAHGEAQQSVQLPRDFENFLRGITFSHPDNKDSAVTPRRGLAQDLQPIIGFLSMLHSDPHARRIAAGIEWLVDSLLTANQTLSLMQSCIGIEAILGDSTQGTYEVGITARLSERYAYLMGSSANNRSELRDKLRVVFAKRGDLIHARRHRLSPYDLQVVQTAQELLHDLIRKELSLVLDRPSIVLSQMDTMQIKRDLRSP